VGVASTSTDETIREFNNKKHYNEWQFIYEPTLDRGGLLNTPAQKPLQGMGMGAGVNQQQTGAGAPTGIQVQTPPAQEKPPSPAPPEQE